MTLNITLLVFILFVPILAFILLALNALLSPHRSYEDKVSSYECGVPVITGQTRESFPIHFNLVAMLFLIFDIELVLLLPISVSLRAVHTYGFVIAIIFFIILTIGFIVELATGAISILPANTTTASRRQKTIITAKNTVSLKPSINIVVDRSAAAAAAAGQSPLTTDPKDHNLKNGKERSDANAQKGTYLTRFMNFDSIPYSIFTNTPFAPAALLQRFIVYIIIPGAIGLFILYCSLYLLKYSGVFNQEELTNILDIMSKTHMP